MPTGYCFYLSSYAGYRPPILKWRFQRGWLRLCEARHSDLRRDVLAVSDEYGEPVPDYIGEALLGMATGSPFEPDLPEPFDELDELERHAAATFEAFVERHYMSEAAAMEARHASERERLERTIDALADELRGALRQIRRAMTGRAVSPALLARLERRRQKLEQAETLLTEALRAGLREHRARMAAEEALFDRQADAPIDIRHRATIFWRIV